MRSRKYRVVTALERLHRLMRAVLHAGIAVRAFALLETSGRPRQTPVGNGLDREVFWLVAAHDTQADYVRNLQASPRARVKTGRTRRSGRVVRLPGDDSRGRSRSRRTTGTRPSAGSLLPRPRSPSASTSTLGD